MRKDVDRISFAFMQIPSLYSILSEQERESRLGCDGNRLCVCVCFLIQQQFSELSQQHRSDCICESVCEKALTRLFFLLNSRAPSPA